MSYTKGWIGVDLDGTLAMYLPMLEWDGSIGEPVPLMLNRIKLWLAAGRKVRIVTARVAPYFDDDARCIETQRKLIDEWLLKHLGQLIPVVAHKDFGMIELWDDRAVRVITNTGERCCDK